MRRYLSLHPDFGADLKDVREDYLIVERNANMAKDPLTVETTDNHIYFYSEVNPDRCLALIREIRKLDADLRNERVSRNLPDDFPMTPIWLHIQSEGGQVFAARALADQIPHIASPIFSIIEGVCGSAATFISLSCNRRYIQPSAFVLIHQMSGGVFGKYYEMVDDMQVNRQLMRQMEDFYVERTKMSRENIGDYLSRESWFNAEKCIELGLADEIMGDNNGSRAS